MLGASAANRARLDRLRPLLASLLKSERERLLGSIGQLDVDSAVQLLSLGLGDPNALLEQALHTALWKLQHLPEDFLWDAPPSQLIDVQQTAFISWRLRATALVHRALRCSWMMAPLSDRGACQAPQPFLPGE